MVRWRLAVVLGLVLLIALPVAWPLGVLAAEPWAWQSWYEAPRLLSLLRNTLLLVVGTLALTLPPGILLAVFLYRTDLPLRGLFRFLILLTLFVPLPLFTSGWQAVLGSSGWLPLALWNPAREVLASSTGGSSWTPWGQGIGSAVWIHAVAGLPWVVLLVGQGLRWADRELEEDALTAARPVMVLLRVTLPRARAALGAAALWVGLQAATEITVTDVMQVRTFAEEVYTQFVGPERIRGVDDALARAVAVTIPGVCLTTLLVLAIARRWQRNLPPRTTLSQPPLIYSLGWLRWPCFLGIAVLVVSLLGLPLASLVWRAGLHGTPPAWSLSVTFTHLKLVSRANGHMILDSLLLAALAGILCAGLALLACWAALGTRWFWGLVLLVAAVVWATPGPVVGLGLKGTMNALIDLTHSSLLARILWYGPSLAPLLWIDLIRFFPCAVAVLWPVVRLLPAELRDAARVDGARPFQELSRVVWPLTASVTLRAVLVVGVLSLGELSAGKLVSTPDMQSYAQEIFTQMHYGVTNNLAALCLLLLVVVLIGGGLVALVGRFVK